MPTGGRRPRLTGTQATIIAAVLGVIGTVVAAIIAAGGQSHDAKPGPASPSQSENGPPSGPSAVSALRLVDVTPVGRTDETTLLDVKMRNIGSKTSIVKRVITHVRKWRDIAPCGVGSPMPITAKYEVTLPAEPRAPTFDTTTELSQFLKPNDSDRFEIEVGLDIEDPFTYGLLFQIQLEFEVDESQSEHLLSDPILISLPGSIPFIDLERIQRARDSFERDCLESDAADERSMLTLPGQRTADLAALTNQLKKGSSVGAESRRG
jgi:hypothetical protein